MFAVRSNRRADRLNRALLLVLALVLIGAGTAALGANIVTDGTQPIVDAARAEQIAPYRTAIWVGVGVVALVVLIVAVRWLLFELRPAAEPGDLRPVPASTSDRLVVTIAPDAVLDLVRTELESLPSVLDARVAARDRHTDPLTVTAMVTMRTGASPAQLRHHVSQRLVPAWRAATATDVVIDLECRFGSGPRETPVRAA